MIYNKKEARDNKSNKSNKDNINNKNNKNKIKIWICIVSFAVPFMMMLVLCAIRHIAPFGDNTFLYLDMKRQYVDFYSYYKSVFTGKNDFIYTGSALYRISKIENNLVKVVPTSRKMTCSLASRTYHQSQLEDLGYKIRGDLL